MNVIRGAHADEREQLVVARVATIVLAIVSIVLGITFKGQNVAYMVGLAFAIAASANFPALVLSIFWKRLTTAGAQVSMIDGYRLDTGADLSVADDSDRHPEARRSLVPAAGTRASSRSRCRLSSRSASRCCVRFRPRSDVSWSSSVSCILASSSRTPWIVVAVVVAVLAIAAVISVRRRSLPEPGTETYEQTTRAFYHGLAALEVGLLDDARQQFTSATTLVPREPASWANLGLTQMRLGELDAAAEPIQHALSLAPDNSDLVLLAARMETARGRLDEGIAGLRRAALLDSRGLRARFALAEELSRLNTPEADKEAQTLLDELATRAPTNLAIQLDRARLAAKLRDAQRLRESVDAIGRDAASWSQQAREQFAVVQKAAAEGSFDEAPRATTILRNVLAPVPAFSESLMAVRTPAELIAEPFDRFLVLASPPATPSVPDTSLTFAAEPIGRGIERAGRSCAGISRSTLTVLRRSSRRMPGSVRRIDGSPGTWPLPVSDSSRESSASPRFDRAARLESRLPY